MKYQDREKAHSKGVFEKNLDSLPPALTSTSMRWSSRPVSREKIQERYRMAQQQQEQEKRKILDSTTLTITPYLGLRLRRSLTWKRRRNRNPCPAAHAREGPLRWRTCSRTLKDRRETTRMSMAKIITLLTILRQFHYQAGTVSRTCLSQSFQAIFDFLLLVSHYVCHLVNQLKYFLPNQLFFT